MTATEMEDSAQSKSAPSAAIEPCEYMDEVRTIVSGIKGFAGDQIATETAHERLWCKWQYLGRDSYHANQAPE